VDAEINSGAAAVAGGEGALVIWAARGNGNDDLYSRNVGAEFEPGEVIRLTNDLGADAARRAVAAIDGTVWVVWEGLRDRQYQLPATSGRNGRFGSAQTVGDRAVQAFVRRLQLLRVTSSQWLGTGWPGDDLSQRESSRPIWVSAK
jgi:hypothetical protein